MHLTIHYYSLSLWLNKDELSKSNTNKWNDNANYELSLLYENHPCLAQTSIDTVSNMRHTCFKLDMSFSFWRMVQNHIQSGPENNLQIRI
jgi:hypothetical protein